MVDGLGQCCPDAELVDSCGVCNGDNMCGKDFHLWLRTTLGDPATLDRDAAIKAAVLQLMHRAVPPMYPIYRVTVDVITDGTLAGGVPLQATISSNVRNRPDLVVGCTAPITSIHS